MPDHDELEMRLSALATSPVGALPGAAAARARGAQRTRRTRAALAVAGSVVAVLAVTAGTALSGGTDRITAPPAGSGPSAPPSAAWDVGSALLAPADAATIEPGEWRADDTTSGRLLDPCEGSTLFPPHADSSGTSLQVQREAGGTTVDQKVYAFLTAGEAASALAAHRDAVQRCARMPFTTAELAGTSSYELVSSAADLLVVRIVQECERCASAPSYAVVAQVDEGLTVLVVSVGEDGDPGDELARQYGELAAQRLALVSNR